MTDRSEVQGQRRSLALWEPADLVTPLAVRVAGVYRASGQASAVRSLIELVRDDRAL
ncbi:hypothetical protein ACGFZQ_02110 [Streptomyces sp. NPDC048254]|uniref:hypothetical protein n=1 Tax=Streptomyces sp. NPDC048254 TaxID=3365525 RepID=UPI00371DEED4